MFLYLSLYLSTKVDTKSFNFLFHFPKVDMGDFYSSYSFPKVDIIRSFPAI